MKKPAVIMATGLAMFLLSACNRADAVPDAKVITAPTGDQIYIDENAFDYCQNEGGRIEMALTPEGGVMQFCTFGEGENMKRCGIYSFYKGDCVIPD